MSKKDITPFVHPNAFHIYTDGSFRPSDSAACAFLIFSEKHKEVIAKERHAFRGMTINQMELMAINLALDRPNMDYVIIYSDSAYSISCLTIWRKGWAARDWKTPLGEPVKNRELIEEIGRKLDAKKHYSMRKVKAHSGDPFNSVVDFMATDLTRMMVTDPHLPNGRY